jgi:hypothetical protein
MSCDLSTSELQRRPAESAVCASLGASEGPVERKPQSLEYRWMHGTQGRSGKALLNPASMGRQLMDGGAARPGKAELLIEFCV